MPEEEVEEISYTTIAYLNTRYKAGLEEGDQQALDLIAEASQMLRDEMPAAVARLEARGKLSTLNRVTARMVSDALPGDTAPMPGGVETTQFGVGPFQQSYRYESPPGRIYITKADRRALRGGQRAGTIDPLQAGAGDAGTPWP